MIAIAEVKAVLPQADPHNYDDNGTYHTGRRNSRHVTVSKSKNGNNTNPMSAETKKMYGILAEFNNPKELIDVSKKVVERATSSIP